MSGAVQIDIGEVARVRVADRAFTVELVGQDAFVSGDFLRESVSIAVLEDVAPVLSHAADRLREAANGGG